MLKDLPEQYVIALIHACSAQLPPPGVSAKYAMYPYGPLLTYVPLLFLTRPLGVATVKNATKLNCQHAVGTTRMQKKASNNGRTDSGRNEMHIPPSQVIKDFTNHHKGLNISDEEVAELGKKVLLPTNEVRWYIKHLQHIQRRRQAGARKAAETRRRRRKCFSFL